MEGYRPQSRERSRPTYQRTASRSSTSTRMTTQSATSATSHMSSSPQLANAYPAHRYHHASCSKPSSSPRPNSRPTPQLSREGSVESARQTPVSSFLQEKLQKTRQAEGQKLALTIPRSNSDMNASFDIGSASTSTRSPLKSSVADISRPQSSGGADPQKKGLALKEMEQVVSGLHKQNFDLKLELYHRRERQTMLEDRMETLETEKAETEQMNDKLVAEMEKRDKAVEEAVAMIVMLEANLAELTKERNMVRQVEAQGFYGSPAHDEPVIEGPPPQIEIPQDVQPEIETKSLHRMPSFLSDRSEKTENLRNVYLGSRGSVLSLSRVAEGSADDMEDGRLHGAASPSLSVLSESSFVSVYGRKGQEKMVPSKVDEPLSLDGAIAKTRSTSRNMVEKPEASQTPRKGSFTRTASGGQYQPITNIIGGSPLQRIERLDPTYSQKRDASRPSSSGKALGPAQEVMKTSRSPARQVSRESREEKREALRKVTTDHSGGVSLHEQAMPPTPDTVASSTLRRFKNSNDTLDRRHDGMEGRSQDSLPPWTNSHELSEPPAPSPMEAEPPFVPTARKIQQQDQLQPLIQRPRSADESTVSHRRGAWDLDYDSDEDSFASNLDFWLRAGSKPQPMSQPHRNDRESPDMFGFPTNPVSGSWAMNAMFGQNGGYSGGVSVNPNSDQILDLAGAQHALFGDGGPPPPPPHRRSSLNAQTGPNATSAEEATPRAPPKVKTSKLPTRRPRHFRRNSDDAQMRANMKTPVPEQFTQPPRQQPGEEKRTHYPPIAGHQGARQGLRGFFRRSIGGGPSSASIEAPAPASTEAVSKEQRPRSPLLPQAQAQPPSWVNRSSAFDDDRSGATPPPIQRQPRQARGSISDADSYAPGTPGMDGTPATPVTAIARAPQYSSPITQEYNEGSPIGGSATGARRKWLPGWSKNKAG